MRPALLYALLWFVAGVVAGLGADRLYGAGDIWLQSGWLSMAIGLALLAIVLRREKAWRAFYDAEERGGLALACVVFVLPGAILTAGLLWLLVSLVASP